MERIEVLSASKGEPESTAGVGWLSGYETSTEQFGEIRVGAGAVGRWHRHANRTLYGYVVAGGSTLEFGPKGKEMARLAQRDFFRVPPHLVHRDVNTHPEEAVILIVNLGEGTATVELDSPDG
ncbi:MAG: cupin domain-containing protein [Thermoplasmata archaeon]|nr:cupin domain-containing protein [Thermoplasmata archaeon]